MSLAEDTDCCHTATKTDALSVLHPLQALTPAEIAKVAAIVNADPPYGVDTRFETIELAGTGERGCTVLQARSADRAERARQRLQHQGHRRDAAVRLARQGHDHLAQGISAGAADDPARAVPRHRGCVRAHPDFIAACEASRHHRHDTVCVDPWSAGNFGDPRRGGPASLPRVLLVSACASNENFYAHPIEGLNAVVDLKTLGGHARRRLRRNADAADRATNYDTRVHHDQAQPLKPIDVVQPDGVELHGRGPARSPGTTGRFVVGFNAREALTLHDIRYDGRPVAATAPRSPRWWCPTARRDAALPQERVRHRRIRLRPAGQLAEARLRLPGRIHYLDAHLTDLFGEPSTIENAICLHEEDAGLSWKHCDFRTDRTEVRRARKLVISSISHRRQLRVRLLLVPPPGRPHRVRDEGHRHHQHRGLPSGPARQVRHRGGAGRGRPYPPARVLRPPRHGGRRRPEQRRRVQHLSPSRKDRRTPTATPSTSRRRCSTTELEAARRANADSQRYWKVVNPNKINVGKPVGYKLEPQLRHAVHPSESPSGKRCQLHPEPRLGDRLSIPTSVIRPASSSTSPTGRRSGSPTSQQDRPIKNADIVLWHSFGLHHLLRLEDHPVQPCVFSGFKLMPHGFFDRNPCIDLPPR